MELDAQIQVWRDLRMRVSPEFPRCTAPALPGCAPPAYVRLRYTAILCRAAPLISATPFSAVMMRVARVGGGYKLHPVPTADLHCLISSVMFALEETGGVALSVTVIL